MDGTLQCLTSVAKTGMDQRSLNDDGGSHDSGAAGGHVLRALDRGRPRGYNPATCGLGASSARDGAPWARWHSSRCRPLCSWELSATPRPGRGQITIAPRAASRPPTSPSRRLPLCRPCRRSTPSSWSPLITGTRLDRTCRPTGSAERLPLRSTSDLAPARFSAGSSRHSIGTDWFERALDRPSHSKTTRRTVRGTSLRRARIRVVARVMLAVALPAHPLQDALHVSLADHSHRFCVQHQQFEDVTLAAPAPAGRGTFLAAWSAPHQHHPCHALNLHSPSATRPALRFCAGGSPTVDTLRPAPSVAPRSQGPVFLIAPKNSPPLAA
jgi:hypothetical protein